MSVPSANARVTEETVGSKQAHGVVIYDASGNIVSSFGGSGTGGTAQTDRSAYVEGAGSFTPVGGTFDDVLGADLTEDTAGAVRVTTKRAFHVNLRSAAGVEQDPTVVQYTEGDTDSTITGVAALTEGPANTLTPLQSDAAKNLLVARPAVATVSTVTSVNDSAASQTLLASNGARKAFKLFNDSTQVAYVKEGTTATTTDYSYKLLPGAFYGDSGEGCYTGRIDCIWAADASGAMKVTETV